ncbi:MAG: RND transporter [Roseicyclus sp.]|uniref:RND transporter n=1 Tax=Roseicyclus sp. TaxID=1914329 RepID=UPI003A8BB5D9
MIALRRFLDAMPLWIVIGACLTLGLAPFTPEPHIWEKLKMLFSGAYFRPIDLFDMLMHGAPFVLLALKLAFWRRAG